MSLTFSYIHRTRVRPARAAVMTLAT